jgi:hypothetical protein
LAPTPATQKIDRGAQFEQRVIVWFDTVHARNWVEDNPFLLILLIGGLRSQNDGAEMNQPPIAGPVDRRVVYDVANISDLHLDDARGSESCPGICSDLQSRDREGAVASAFFSILLEMVA